MKKEKFYIFIDLASTNACLWDDEDSIREYGDKKSNQIYLAEHRAKVGRDSIDGLNILIDHARKNLGLEPVVVLAHQKHARTRLPIVMMSNLKKGGLNDCIIEDWGYNPKKVASFGREAVLKMYHEENNKKESFLDRFHYNYAMSANNVCVLLSDENAYLEPKLGGLYYKGYFNGGLQVILLGGKYGALNAEMAREFVTVSCAYNRIENKLLFDSQQDEQEIEIQNADALATLEEFSKNSNDEVLDSVDEAVEVAEAIAEGIEPERE